MGAVYRLTDATTADDKAASPARSLDFTRAPFSMRGRTHIESRCNQCGFRIVGTTGRDFDDQEREHAAVCSGSDSE